MGHGWRLSNFSPQKQIIRPSESQPYIKKQEKSIDTIDSIDTLQQKYR